MRAKQLPLFIVALALIALMTVPAFADPVAATSPSIGDRYAITAISVEARAWIVGSWVVSSADLQLVVQVTNVGPNNIIFRTLSGTIRFDGKVYNIVADGWRGDYKRVSKTCAYQGPAIAPNGARAFFITGGHDTSDTQQGTYMRMWSAFRDENAVLWRIDLQTCRFKLNWKLTVNLQASSLSAS